MRTSTLFPLLALCFALPTDGSKLSVESGNTADKSVVNQAQKPVEFCIMCGSSCGSCSCGDSSSCGGGGSSSSGSDCSSGECGSSTDCTTGDCTGNGPDIIGSHGGSMFRNNIGRIEQQFRADRAARLDALNAARKADSRKVVGSN